MRKLARIAAAAAALCLLAGCGFKDIDKRFFVIMVGVDKGKSKAYEVSLKLAIPSPKMEPGEAKFQLVSQEADSITEAIRLMKSKVDKEFDFGHTKLLIIGKPYARGDMSHSLDWLFRRRDIQQISYLALGDPDAKSILEVKPPSERLPGNALMLSMTDEGTESPYIVPVYLYDYYRRIKSRSEDAYLPVVKAAKDTYEIDRVAILRGTRTRLELSPPETAIFNQLIRQYSRFSLKGRADGGNLHLNVESFSRSFKIITPPEGSPVIRMRISVDGEVEESDTPIFNRKWDKIERDMESRISEETAALLEKLRDAGTDPVGFGLRYRAEHHDPAGEWAEWQKLYPRVRFEVTAKVNIRGSGIIR